MAVFLDHAEPDRRIAVGAQAHARAQRIGLGLETFGQLLHEQLPAETAEVRNERAVREIGDRHAAGHMGCHDLDRSGVGFLEIQVHPRGVAGGRAFPGHRCGRRLELLFWIDEVDGQGAADPRRGSMARAARRRPHRFRIESLHRDIRRRGGGHRRRRGRSRRPRQACARVPSTRRADKNGAGHPAPLQDSGPGARALRPRHAGRRPSGVVEPDLHAALSSAIGPHSSCRRRGRRWREWRLWAWSKAASHMRTPLLISTSNALPVASRRDTSSVQRPPAQRP